jgi:DNA-binding CsgD family transcriptional regulator/tetratricopeptide (TPR) repeat protein
LPAGRRIFQLRDAQAAQLEGGLGVILRGMEVRASDVFVGRARELEALARMLDAMQLGNGATVLVAGEGGIGKTRLVSEFAGLARDAGFEVLLGRSIDLVGTELPFQPFVEALRPLGQPLRADGSTPGSQLRVFEDTLARVTDRAATAPVLLVLEDLHWADTSSLDLLVFLAHNLYDRQVLLLATYRAGEPSSAKRMRRLAEGVRRSGSALLLELGPLESEELTMLLAARSASPLPAALTDTIVARSEGNPFFAEELLAAASDQRGELPRGLRDLLLQRVDRLDDQTQSLLQLASAVGRDVGYALLCAVAGLSEAGVRRSLHEAVAHGVLVADQPTQSVRFRHPLLAEAVYTTILPGEREELHARIADELARSGATGAAELAPHWAAAGRSTEAVAASVEAARQAAAVFGLAEALSHLERALALWRAVPDAADLVGLDLAELCSWASELASQTGAAPRAHELGRRAIELVGDADPRRSALLHVQLGEYLYETGSNEAGLAAVERAVELVPAEPPSPERAYSLGSLAGVLMVEWRHAESLPIAEQALALARRVGAPEAEVRALTVLGVDLVHLGRAKEGLAQIRPTLQLAEEVGDRVGLERAYGNFTDVLTRLGRPRESARLGREGLEATRRYGITSTLLICNQVEALLAVGDWDEADWLSAAALRGIPSSFRSSLLTVRAEVEIGRGEFDAARAHLESAGGDLFEYRALGLYDYHRADLALWERRWTDAAAAIDEGLARARQHEAAQICVQLCATGLRAQAELAALARARRDGDALRGWLDRARELIGIARATAVDAGPITPNAAGWLAVAEAEYERASGVIRPESWSEAAAAWVHLERPPLAAYCRWRQAEALVAAGAPRAEASVPLREAHSVATRMGAVPLVRELELLAQRARLDLAPPGTGPPARNDGLEELLGLTPREAEVLTLVARGYTNREIADELVISVKTASVHVSHILRKLAVPNRVEAAAVAHRLEVAGDTPAELGP